ncbi:hypothetical protein [Frondihabitans cladoniiphilus]|uniref:hypothetical protein n=1 Tax=Frondihabitans cladoniiphilus TaxID=715785 RepID=UPI0031EE9068
MTFGIETLDQSEAEKVGPLSGLDYQAFWTADAPHGWLDQALHEFASWARERLHLEVDLSKDSDVSNPDRSRRVQVLHRVAGRDVGVRLRAWNSNHGTTFTVTVLAVDGPNGGWLLVQASSSDRSRRTDKPAVADRILAVVDFSDIGPLRSSAQHISTSQIDELEDLINHPDRRFPVIVAAPIDGIDFDRWLKAVTRWTRHCAGIAHVVSLDPNSAQEFNRRHNRRGVQTATLRTYPPGTDLADPAVEQAARWLTPRALAGPEPKVARIIESFVREYQVTHPVPLASPVRDWSRAFDRFAAQELRSAVSPVSATLQDRVAARQAARKSQPQTITVIAPLVSPAPELSELADARSASREETEISLLRIQLATSEARQAEAVNRLEHVQEFLSLPNLEENSLLELLDAATQTTPDTGAIAQLLSDNDDLRTKVEELEDLLIDEQVNNGDLSLERDRLEVLFNSQVRETAFLRAKVAETDPVSAYSWVDEGEPSNPLGECPTDWDGLLADPRLGSNGLVFTGSARRIKEVANLDLDGAGLQAAWDAFGTLASYRTARLAGSWDSNVHSFCQSGPVESFHVPPNKHAQDETSSTRKDSRLADHRLLPVPKSVDESEHVYMWAHFKPFSWSAHQKLRIHYYDQVTTDQTIYIGHVGAHLPSGSTDKIRR